MSKTTQEQLNDAQKQLFQLQEEMKALESKAKEEENNARGEAEIILGQIVIKTIGQDWKSIDPIKLIDCLSSRDDLFSTAKEPSPAAALKQLKTAFKLKRNKPATSFPDSLSTMDVSKEFVTETTEETPL